MSCHRCGTAILTTALCSCYTESGGVCIFCGYRVSLTPAERSETRDARQLASAPGGGTEAAAGGAAPAADAAPKGACDDCVCSSWELRFTHCAHAATARRASAASFIVSSRIAAAVQWRCQGLSMHRSSSWCQHEGRTLTFCLQRRLRPRRQTPGRRPRWPSKIAWWRCDNVGLEQQPTAACLASSLQWSFYSHMRSYTVKNQASAWLTPTHLGELVGACGTCCHQDCVGGAECVC